MGLLLDLLALGPASACTWTCFCLDLLALASAASLAHASAASLAL